MNKPKYKKLKTGDTIIFSKLPELKEKVRTKIKSIKFFGNFKDLIWDYPIAWFGPRYKTRKEKYVSIYKNIKSFTPENEKKYGVLGIELELV